MPETLDYMIFGYVMGLGLLALLIASIWWRYRSLEADEAALVQLEKEVQAEAPTPNRWTSPKAT